MMSRIWKEEKNTVIGLFISVLALATASADTGGEDFSLF